MEVLNQEHVRSELIQLTEKQVSTLEKRKFDGLTEAELRLFEERQKRIRDLFIELHHLDWAALVRRKPRACVDAMFIVETSP